MYLLMCRSYEALNADGLDKTSRQKLQFEKVIISYSFKKYIEQMYCKNIWFSPKKVYWEFQ